MSELSTEITGQESDPQSSYYYSLKCYSPFLYWGKGVPIFLLRKDDSIQRSLYSLLLLNIIYIILSVLQRTSPNDMHYYQEIHIANNVNSLALLFTNFSYFLTATMNPGIVSELDMQVQSQDELRYCQLCIRKINKDMKHCSHCQTCVTDLDHHCFYLGKCIAGAQRIAFYAFIAFTLGGLISLVVTWSLMMGFNLQKQFNL